MFLIKYIIGIALIVTVRHYALKNVVKWDEEYQEWLKSERKWEERW